MPLYTRSGDTGMTELPSAQAGQPRRVRKDQPIMHAMGSLDELNAAIGWCLVQAQPAPDKIRASLAPVQPELALAGEALTGRQGDKAAEPCREAALRLERAMDDLCAGLPDLRQFIRPAGCELACRLQLARAICRRAERWVLAAGEETHPASAPAVLQYLNRLSDTLFALARQANHDAGLEDQPLQMA